MENNELWTPYRWGLAVRKVLLKYASSYGKKASTRFLSRRWLAVFVNTILDDKHQELVKNTPHYNNLKK